MFDQTNCLNGNYHKNFLSHQIGEAVKQIPQERRRQLAAEIQTRAAVMGCKDHAILEKVLKRLRKEEQQ